MRKSNQEDKRLPPLPSAPLKKQMCCFERSLQLWSSGSDILTRRRGRPLKQQMLKLFPRELPLFGPVWKSSSPKVLLKTMVILVANN